MKICDHCGNAYERCIDITVDGETYSFDCFECAIHLLAPACDRCGCRIIGHGVEADGAYYCCAHCARGAGVEGVVDNVNKGEEGDHELSG
jgi:hypothetical protein